MNSHGAKYLRLPTHQLIFFFFSLHFIFPFSISALSIFFSFKKDISREIRAKLKRRFEHYHLRLRGLKENIWCYLSWDNSALPPGFSSCLLRPFCMGVFQFFATLILFTFFFWVTLPNKVGKNIDSFSFLQLQMNLSPSQERTSLSNKF